MRPAGQEIRRTAGKQFGILYISPETCQFPALPAWPGNKAGWYAVRADSGHTVAAGHVAGSPQSRPAPGGRPAWTVGVGKHAFRSDGSHSGNHRAPGRVCRPRPGILSAPLPRRARIPISGTGRISVPPARRRPVENHGVRGWPDRGSLSANPATRPNLGRRMPCRLKQNGTRTRYLTKPSGVRVLLRSISVSPPGTWC